MKNSLETAIGGALLQNPLVRAGAIDRLDIEELARIAHAEHALHQAEDIKSTIESLLQQIPQSRTPEQRVQFYRQVNRLYQDAKNDDRRALVDFVDKYFNRAYNGGHFFDETDVQVISFALGYMLIKHDGTYRKIKGPRGIRPLYSGHPIEVVLNYADAFDAVNRTLPSLFARTNSADYINPEMRAPHFADVITLLWHDLPEEELLSLGEMKEAYLGFVDAHIPKERRETFRDAAERILTGVQDLTREGTYFDLVRDMQHKKRRAFLMQKTSDIIANADEMDDIPGTLVQAYNAIRDRVLGVLGYDSRVAQYLRQIKNHFAVGFLDIDRSINYAQEKKATFSAADRIRAMFRGFMVRDAISWYSAETKDWDPYLIQLRDRLVRAILERGDQLQFHLLNYYCNGFEMPLNLSPHNWRLHNHIHPNGRMAFRYVPDFLKPYLGSGASPFDLPKAEKPFDVEVMRYLDGELQQAVDDRSLFRITESGRGRPFDGLVDRYYSSLINPTTRRQVMREIDADRTLQYMLTIALIRWGEEYRNNPNFRFNWTSNPLRIASPGDYVASKGL